MDTQQMKSLAQKAGVLEDDAEEDTTTSWIDKQYQIARKVLQRRANADKKAKQRVHMDKHGVDAGTIARAEELQVLLR